jgi:hypothetical protein
MPFSNRTETSRSAVTIEIPAGNPRPLASVALNVVGGSTSMPSQRPGTQRLRVRVRSCSEAAAPTGAGAGPRCPRASKELGADIVKRGGRKPEPSVPGTSKDIPCPIDVDSVSKTFFVVHDAVRQVHTQCADFGRNEFDFQARLLASRGPWAAARAGTLETSKAGTQSPRHCRSCAACVSWLLMFKRMDCSLGSVVFPPEPESGRQGAYRQKRARMRECRV